MSLTWLQNSCLFPGTAKVFPTLTLPPALQPHQPGSCTLGALFPVLPAPQNDRLLSLPRYSVTTHLVSSLLDREGLEIKCGLLQSPCRLGAPEHRAAASFPENPEYLAFILFALIPIWCWRAGRFAATILWLRIPELKLCSFTRLPFTDLQNRSVGEHSFYGWQNAGNPESKLTHSRWQRTVVIEEGLSRLQDQRPFRWRAQ